MEVMVERNLSPWYKDVPLVNVNVYLRPVEVSGIYCIHNMWPDLRKGFFHTQNS